LQGVKVNGRWFISEANLSDWLASGERRRTEPGLWPPGGMVVGNDTAR